MPTWLGYFDGQANFRIPDQVISCLTLMVNFPEVWTNLPYGLKLFLMQIFINFLLNDLK
jgi:hypothetical protein